MVKFWTATFLVALSCLAGTGAGAQDSVMQRLAPRMSKEGSKTQTWWPPDRTRFPSDQTRLPPDQTRWPPDQTQLPPKDVQPVVKKPVIFFVSETGATFTNERPLFDQSAQKPQVPQSPNSAASPRPVYKPNEKQHPQPPPAQRCDVEGSVRIPCGSTDISAEECVAIDCCFDGRQCYFGKTVTVQCTRDAQFIVVVAKDTTLPNIDLETISLLEEGCTHIDSNSAFAIYQFPVTGCGSIVMEESDTIVYENKMTSSYEVGVGPFGAITRDSHYHLIFQCRYKGTSVQLVQATVTETPRPVLPVAAEGPIRVHMRLANGKCQTKGCNELNVAYSSFYAENDYPVTIPLREAVYVEVQLLEKTDPNLVLTLGRCWATTSSSPHSLPQWDLLVDGCPYRDDRYLTSLVTSIPGSQCKRFVFKMFTFVDQSSLEPRKQQVYIHCSTAVCVPGQGENCEQLCYRRKRDTKAVDQKKTKQKVVVSTGAVIITDVQE